MYEFLPHFRMDCLRDSMRVISRRKTKIESGEFEFEREKLNFGENLGVGPTSGAVFGCPIDQQDLEKVT